MLRIREIREYKGKPRTISSSTTRVGKYHEADDAAYMQSSSGYGTPSSQYDNYTHGGSTIRQHLRSSDKHSYPTHREYSDKERYESEKPSVSKEDKLLREGHSLQKVSKLKWKTQDRARQKIQDEWNRDHQEEDDYPEAEERWWDEGAAQLRRAPDPETREVRRTVNRSVTVSERDDRGQSSHYGYSATAHYPHHYGTQLAGRSTWYYFEGNDDRDSHRHRYH
ncbi:hypothetical protein F5B22DRAFT_250943 [Xylaria bambusicola]|uniref:uncharacterized protein n=1 Tax=Xylaria bambusicola TaxID=326684 RepID=UPI002007DF9B|nr:uncharacterized protein F5B22DRAFT_250943 [Xylaria bambusicola]KAI0525739.1 hypothetical protein F5B22DRAFT_250943 [Xylaria bambusicola]